MKIDCPFYALIKVELVVVDIAVDINIENVLAAVKAVAVDT